MRRAADETLMSALALVLLVSALVAFDPRVRDQIGTTLSRGGSASTATALTTMVSEIASAVFQSARDQSLAHAPLLVFGVVAAVLVTFMLRT